MSIRRSRKKPGKGLRLALILAAVSCVGYAALSVGLSRFLDPEELAERLEPRLERAMNRDVQIARVDVGLFPLSIDLVDLTVADPTGLAPTLAKARSASFRVALLPLLTKRVDVRRLVLDGFEADLRVGADEHTNFGDFSPQPAEEEGGAPGSEPDPSYGLDLRRVLVRDARIRYASAFDSTRVDLAGLSGRGSARSRQDGRWGLEIQLGGHATYRSRTGGLAVEGVPTSLSGSLEASSDFQALEISEGEARLGPIAVTVGGTVEGILGTSRKVALELVGANIPLAETSELFIPQNREDRGLEPQGSLSLNLSLNGELAEGLKPRLTGEVRVESGSMQDVRMGALAEAVEGSLAFFDNRAPELRLEGRSFEGPFTLEGAIDLGRGGAFDLSVRGNPSLSGLQAGALLPEGMTLAGRLEANLRLVGRPDDLGGLRVLGEARPSRLRVTHPSLRIPADIPSGRIRFTGRGISVQGLPVLFSGDRLSVSGEIPDVGALLSDDGPRRVWAAIRGTRLDLRDLIGKPLPDPSLSYGKIAFARLGGRPIGIRSPEAAARELGLFSPDSLPMAGSLEISLDTLIDRRSRSEEVRARFEFTPRHLRLTSSSMSRYGGRLSASGALSLAGGETNPFSLRFEASDLDASAFLSTVTPVKEIVAGRLDLSADFLGSLDDLLLPDPESLAGSGQFLLVEGSVARTPLTESLSYFLDLGTLREPKVGSWTAPFLIEAGRVLLGEAVVEGAPGNPSVGGTVGLDGALDLATVFQLEAERLDVGVMDRLAVPASLVEELRSRGELLRAALLIGGSLLAPSISAGAPVRAEAVEEAVEARVRAEAQQRLEEERRRLQERASGFLRGVLGRPTGSDTTASDTVEPDTVPPDTLRQDTVPPDTVPPDTLKPDTVPPDTLRPDTLKPDTLPPKG